MEFKMKRLKYILSSCCVLCLLISCDTKQDVLYTGVANPYFDGTIMDYLKSNDRNWDLTVQMIEHADLVELFEGRVDTCLEITFFAPPAYSILRFMLESQEKAIPGNIYEKVTDIPEALCREYILKHVVKGKYLKEDIAYINKDFLISDEGQDGGTLLTCLGGNVLRAYLQRSSWAGVPDAGPVTMGLYSVTSGNEIPLATPDIQPTNGVVHALNYGYDFSKI